MDRNQYGMGYPDTGQMSGYPDQQYGYPAQQYGYQYGTGEQYSKQTGYSGQQVGNTNSPNTSQITIPQYSIDNLPSNSTEKKKKTRLNPMIPILIGAGVIIAALLFIGLHFFLQRHKSTPITDEALMKNYFLAINSKDGDGVTECFVDRELLSDTDAEIVELMIGNSLLSDVQFDVDTINIAKKTEIDDVHKHLEINKDVTKAEIINLSVKCQSMTDGAETDAHYIAFLLKLDGKWYIYEIGSDTETEEGSGTPIINNNKTDIDNFATGTIKINDTEYFLPCKLSEIIGNYKIDNDSSLNPGEYRECILYNGTDVMGVSVTVNNMSEKELDPDDCYVTSVFADRKLADGTEEAFKFIVPGGGTYGMSPDDIKKIYGKPQYTYGESDISYKYVYNVSGIQNGYNECSIIFRFYDGTAVDSITYSYY